jgi:hypothetical protein
VTASLEHHLSALLPFLSSSISPGTQVELTLQGCNSVLETTEALKPIFSQTGIEHLTFRVLSQTDIEHLTLRGRLAPFAEK